MLTNSQELTAAIQPVKSSSVFEIEVPKTICYASPENEVITKSGFEPSVPSTFNPPTPSGEIPTYTPAPDFLDTVLVETPQIFDAPSIPEGVSVFPTLTADFNPKIQLEGIIKNPADFTIVGYMASISYMGVMKVIDDYIPTASEAKQLLESLRLNLPIITNVQSYDSNGVAQFDIRWYSLSADGSFESTTYTNWKLVQNRLNQVGQLAPIAQAVDTVTEIQFTTQAASIDVEQVNKFVPSVTEGSVIVVPFVEAVQPYQFEKSSLQVEQGEPVQFDLSAITPIQTSEFTLGDAEFWRRFEKKSETVEQTSVEINFEFAEV